MWLWHPVRLFPVPLWMLTVQEASSFQTIGQRILLWGQLNVTMLITLTGQSKVEEAHMEYIHRPKHIANLLIARVRVGKE